MSSIHIFSSYDCDEFTKAFYHHNFGVTDFTPVTVEAPKAQALEKVCASQYWDIMDDHSLGVTTPQWVWITRRF